MAKFFHLPVCLSFSTQMPSYLCLADCPGLKVSQVLQCLCFQSPLLLEEGGRGELGKFWELVQPSLQNVVWQMVETKHFVQLFGKTRMNNLVQENLLVVEGAKGRQAGVTTDQNHTTYQNSLNMHPVI